VIDLFDGAYRGRKVLVTGHSGFKGGWLCRWLELLGAEVSGYSLPPQGAPNLHELLAPRFAQTFADIRSSADLGTHLLSHKPEIVFHLAAQPLVGRSYEDPVETFDTNARGTWTLLEAAGKAPDLAAMVVVTTDKCYRNPEDGVPFREEDPLGGHDPYSASKACCEILCESWRASIWSGTGSPLLATARAGNVIGGGDWSVDRLLPDALRAERSGVALRIRHPESVRPWQHVLEPLLGYLQLGARLLSGERSAARAWNFGPTTDQVATVHDVLSLWRRLRPTLHVEESPAPAYHEAGLLALNSARSRAILGWSTRWDLERALRETERWHSHLDSTGACLCDAQILEYTAEFAGQREIAA
jgi:CDP-glucose 4,6-dehydratase